MKGIEIYRNIKYMLLLLFSKFEII